MYGSLGRWISVTSDVWGDCFKQAAHIERAHFNVIFDHFSNQRGLRRDWIVVVWWRSCPPSEPFVESSQREEGYV